MARYRCARILGRGGDIDDPIRPDVTFEPGDWCSIRWGEGYGEAELDAHFTSGERMRRFEERHEHLKKLQVP